MLRALGLASAYVPNTNQRPRIAEEVIRACMPGVRLRPDVLRRAVDLWPTRKHGRTQALHDLASDLGCDSKTLLTQLSQGREGQGHPKTKLRI